MSPETLADQARTAPGTVRILANHVNGGTHEPRQGAYLDDVNPATGEIIAKVPRSGAEDVDAAVAAAKKAFPAWAATSVVERAAFLDKIADQIEKHADILAAQESEDTGKPLKLAKTVDIPRAVANFRFFAGAVRHDETAFHHMDGAINYTLRKPLGPVGLITPWNLPLYLLSWKVAPALAMGNTVVAKPSEMTPVTASTLARLTALAALPPGVFNLVHGLGAEAGQRLVEHPDVKAVSFTGGTKTGRQVAATAAPMFKKLSLELGGKNASVVFADCDFDATVEGVARAAFTNQGQVCLCGSRILVEQSIYEPFLEAFAERVARMKVGDPRSPDTDLGALISTDHRDKVEGYVQQARGLGGTIVTGGARPTVPGKMAEGAFYAPTVVSGLAPDCAPAQEEIFGPVVTVHPFRDEAEAVRIANDVQYGLAATVWTKDLDKAHRVSATLDTGMVWVNTWLLRDLRVPFGGMKDSGVGREGGRYSLEFFSESRNVCVKLGSA